MYDLIIIGSGPAGLTAGIYASRARLNTLVLEQNFVSGGQIIDTYEIDNYPGLPGISGMDLADRMSQHAEKLGVAIENVIVTSLDLTGPVKKVITDDNVYEAKAVIIASGATHSHLGAPGEEEFAGHGVSYCATCDGGFYRKKDTLVVGGGDVAVEDAIYLARLCNKVYVVHRRDELRAAKVLQENLLSLPNVEMVWNSVVRTINGTQKVESVTVTNVKDGSERTIPVQGAFIAVGISPRSEFAKNHIEMDEKGYIIADETGKTNIPGVFAAGDVRGKQLRQVVTAVADGANAVTSVEKYLLTLK
ncbi:MAG: thioredoxin-disulfide reductase [Lachnospiraceae bacterium]|jgi:thioredoxin reductase (NADPH)|nr:thioredoxin-disulfide reductase [Lachnospiraceae bacterium]